LFSESYLYSGNYGVNEMAEDNLEDIKKLPVAERIERLKALELKKKGEMDEAAALLKSSLEETRRQKAVENVELPESQPVDITKLFASDEKSLEAVVSREIPSPSDEDAVKYELQLDYNVLTKIQDNMEGYKLQKAVVAVEDRVNELVAKMDYANMSKDVADQLVATRSVIYMMKKRAGL